MMTAARLSQPRSSPPTLPSTFHEHDTHNTFQHACASVINHDTILGHMTKECCHHDEHATLQRHPILWAAVGVSQTFLTAIIFGWASLVPVLRDEGLNYTPTELSQIFTCGAVGMYLATLPFGILLDLQGPKRTGIVASLLYALGLGLCAFDGNFYCFAIGFGLVGLARPGIQMPTLHLANLFQAKTRESGGGHGGAVYMSMQAAAFDAGTLIFFLFNQGYFRLGLSSSTMFLMYLVVPAWTLATAIWVWPNETLEKETDDDGNDGNENGAIGSPHWSPKDRKRKAAIAAKQVKKKGLVNAPLSVILTHVSFYALATWVGTHIYKLNFMIATINDQLLRHFDSPRAGNLIDILGAMLPFGFVVLPIVATMLHTKPMVALQVANVVGILYGGVMTFVPDIAWLQIFVVFPAVATSRQLVYSTLFHTIAKVFGFANYGVLLGLTNAIASLFQMLQTPMVMWSEDKDSYFWSNFILWVATFPLLFTVLYTNPTWTPAWRFTKKGQADADSDDGMHAAMGASEKTSLLRSVSSGLEQGGCVGGTSTSVAASTANNSQASASTDATGSSSRQ